MGLWGKVPVGQDSRGQVGEIIESILNDVNCRKPCDRQVYGSFTSICYTWLWRDANHAMPIST